jgi:hypothetical protein
MARAIHDGEKGFPSNSIQPPINAKPLTRFEGLRSGVLDMNADVKDGRRSAGGLAPEIG